MSTCSLTGVDYTIGLAEHHTVYTGTCGLEIQSRGCTKVSALRCSGHASRGSSAWPKTPYSAEVST